MQLLRSSGDPVDVSDREYYKQAMNGSVYVSDIQVSKSTGDRMATFAVPVFDAEHANVIGVVQRNYNLSDFHDLLASEVTEERQEIVLVDRTGSVIAHSGHEIAADSPEDQSMNPFYTDSRGEVYEGSYESLWERDTWMISWIKEPKTGWVVASCQVKGVALSHVYLIAAVTLVLTAIFVVI
ncbi:MAG: cache domain-containing protein, partial [Lachnospiraceae bacterium]|nr:cache domain-containing protein [Lachnospiraceae bacterium]